MKTTRLLVLLIASLFCLCKSALAQEDNREAYAVLDGNTLTFYYDNERSTRNGSKYSIPWNTNYQPGWYIYRDGITIVVFDDSFSNYHELSSTANMFYELTDLTTIEGIANLKTENVTDMSYMFYNCYNLGSLDLTSFNTSNVTNMSNMFSSCSTLTSLDLSSFNTSKVTNMSDMFSSCSGLNSLNVSSFNTEMVENMSNMFSWSRNINSLDLSNFNTSNVNDMSNMFEECWNLTSLTLSPLFKTPNVENMTNMFYNCYKLGSLNLSSFETTKVEYMNCMFYDCRSLKNLDLSSFYTNAIIEMNGMFSGCTNLQSVDIRNFSISNSTTSTSTMFWGCENLTEIICLNSFDVENLNSESMFSFCTNLKGSNGTVFDSNKVDGTYAHPDGGPSNPGYFTDGKPYAILSDVTLTFYYDLNKGSTGFDFPTNNNAPDWTALEVANTITTVTFDESFHKYTGLTSPKLLFNGLSNLATINNLNYLNTDYVTDMSYIFSGCSGLTSLDLSGLNTENVTNMSHMFSGCSSLTSIDVSKISTAYVTDMSYMFSGCGSLEELDLSSFNTENVTDMSYMFSGCGSLEELDLSSFNTESVTDMSYMFSGCSSLTSLDVSSFDVDNVTNMTEMFSGCSSLATIYCNNDWSDGNVSSSDNMFTGCPFVQDNNVTVDFAKPSADGGYFSVPPKAYAYLNNHQLIFRYDDNWFDLDNVFTVNEEDEEGSPEWWMFYREVTQVIFEQSFSVSRPTSTANWFASMRYLESITGLEYLNTEAVTDMNSMFYGCENLTSLDLTRFNVSNVTNMSYMFANCSNLEMIYAGDWSNIGCQSSNMFDYCFSLPGYNENNCYEYYDIAWAKPTDDEGVGFFSTRQVYAIVEDDNLSFHYDGKNTDKTTYDIDWINVEEELNWKTKDFTTVTFDPSFADYKLTSTAEMFSGLTGLTTINGLDNLNTTSITDMSNMFSGCSGLETIYCGKDWSGLNVKSPNMFAGCAKLPNFDPSQVTVAKAHPYDKGYFTQLPQAYAVQEGSVLTFYYDNKINTHSDAIIYEIPWEEGGIEGGEEGSGGGYPGWINFGDEEGGGYAPARKSAKARTANEPITLVVFDRSFKNYHGLNSTANMFYRMGSLTSIEGLEYLNTENVTTMRSMFEGCSSLTSLDLTSFNTEKVSTMQAMFAECSRLTSLNLSNFITYNVEVLYDMFNGCSSLTTLDLTNFDMTKVTDVDEVFYNCSSLETIFCNVDWSSHNFTYSSDIFNNCSSLVGGNGTKYSDVSEEAQDDPLSFAHPDASGNPGFFTALSEGKIILYDSSTNTNTISSNDENQVDVYFCERTLYRDGDWNTLCLPFSLTAEQLAESPLAGFSELRTLSDAQYEEGTLTLNFTLTEGSDAVTSIEAGKPYLIKWDQQSTDIVNPTFTDVTIQNVSESQMKVATDYVDFVGNFNPITIGEAGDNTKLYLGASNGLYYPNGASTFYGFRAYFQLKNGLTAGPGPSTGSSQVKAFRLNFGDEENGIFLMEDGRSKMEDAYFTLDGRRLLDKPTQRGMYINNGRKVLIK